MVMNIRLEAFRKYLDENIPSLGFLKGLSKNEIKEKLIIFFTEGAEGKLYPPITNFEDNLLYALHEFGEWLKYEKKIDSEVVDSYLEPLHLKGIDEILKRLEYKIKSENEMGKKIINFPIK